MTLRSLFTAGALVTLGMLAGRILGLLREMLLAGTFGAGHEADTAILLLIIPDFVTAALIGGGASATLIPAFAAREPKDALALLWQALVASVAFLTLVALGMFMYMRRDHGFTAFDAHPGVFLLFLSALPLTAATSILTAWLQYRGRFSVPAFATGIFNGALVLTLWLMPVGLVVLAGGIWLAALLRLLAHMAAFARAEGCPPASVYGVARGRWQLNRPLLKHYAATASSSILSMFPQFAPYGILALAGGGVAIFNYAFKLILMPAMLGVGVVQMVLLPWLVHYRRSNDTASGTDSSYALTLRLAWILSLALCLSLSLASYDIVTVFFSYGKMTGANVAAVARLFAIGVWALPGMLLTGVWQQIMFAHANPRDPLIANALLAVFVLPVCWLGNALMGLEGMAWLYAAIQLVPVVWLARAGCRLRILSRCYPSFAYVRVTLAVLVPWLPLAGLFYYLHLPALAGVLAASTIGAVTLASGGLACPPVKLWLSERLGR